MAPALDPSVAGGLVTYRPRNYQLEMLGASMKENIIIAMDTGSGKTHIAVLRIMKELERCPPQKLVWFLAPTVDLAIQQHKVISSSIPSVRARIITGLDKVELWSEQHIWDAILDDVAVVVSTHAVLGDALSHGFVNILRLALIVFDEAHHCRGRHPANKIMLDFYRPARAEFGPHAVPHILGLTASPIMKSRPRELSKIESNMHAVCKTPRESRAELLEHTQCPDLEPMIYPPVVESEFDCASLGLRRLFQFWRAMDIEDDPYVRRLRKRPGSEEKLLKALDGKTYCQEQMKKFASRSAHISEELGPWAADYYIQASISQLTTSTSDSSIVSNWNGDEKAYLVNILSQIPLPAIQLDITPSEQVPISPKLKMLIDFLDRIYHPDFSGIIFVTQRVAVTVLVHLLSVHPLTKGRFRCAAYVGWSGNSNRKECIGDLHHLRSQRDTLNDFRSGRKNLIVSTDVLEEGIDISACRLVICFDKPPNLKSFVQRRGRARQKKSTYAIMLASNDKSANLDALQSLEETMIQAYQDEKRRLRQELEPEEDEEVVDDQLRVESTGAVLTADMAVGHLHHFCSLLPAQPYSDNRPEISVDSVEADTYLGTVVLPSSVHPDVRHTQGSRVWLTRRAARRDAAFQAYKSLYEFGLINDNLLPLTSEPEVADAKSSGLASVMDVSGQYDPWIELSHSWDSPDIHQHCVSVEHNGVLVKELSMALTVPACLPALAQITLFWDAETTFTVSFGAGKRPESLSSGQLRHLQSTTAIFLQAVRTRALNVKNDFVALLGPDIAAAELKSWIDANSGSDPALEVYSPECSGNAYSTGIVRDRMNYNEPLIFRRWLASGSNIELECDTLPRRRNLLSCQILAGRLIGIDNINLTKTRIVPAEACTIDRLPFGKSIFGLFISAIMEKLSTLLIATKLRNAVLKTVEFRNIHHVITGISAPSAQTGVDYQRYEFFGDSVLKYTVSCLLFFQHPNWHEGYLSQYRDRFVKNHSLTRAALDAGLDAFVMTDTFSPRKWTAPLISEKVAATSSQRQLSAKVLADVVEALIGAAYMDGGMTAAQACIRNFLPNIDLQKLDTQSIPVPSSNDHVMNRHLAQHIGYNFNNEALLLEALTHPSCDFDPSTQSYQRLEFLGDAVLDIIVVTALSKYPVEIPQGVMTMTKAALVNANLLAYFCMEFSVTEQKPNVHQKSNGRFSLTHTEESFELWRFMRCRDQALTINRDATIERHRALRSQIADSLLHSNSYPWHLLCQINAEKFFSDLIESILGAIFVDSNGDLSACETFLERIGLLPYLRRVLADNVLVVHPRSLAQNMAQTLTKSNISFEVEQTRNEARAEFLYSCSVALDGAILARVEDCLSREEAEVKASIDAVDWLKASS